MPQQPQSNSGKSSTYVQLPDNSYLEVPAGVSDQEVHSRISTMFPDAFKSDPSAASPIPPPMYTSKRGGESPVSRNSFIPKMQKAYLNTGNPVPDRPGVDLLTKNGAGVARAIYSQTTPGVIHGLLKRFGVTQSGPDLMKETIPNAVATFAGGLEGAPEGAGGEGGARPVERSGSNRPATRGPVPGRATPSKSTPKSFGPMDAATLLPGMAGRAARLLQKFGIGEAETAAPQIAEPMADFGTPSHLRGQRVKAGTLTLDTGIPKSVRPEPAWKSQPNGGTPVESILQRNPEAGPAKPREGNPNNTGAPFPRKPTWQNQPTPESRAASDAAFNKLHPVSEFKSGMDPVAEAQWQESAFGQKPVEDIGAKVRTNQPPVPRTTTATAKGRAIDNQALGNVMKGEDARNLSTSDLSSRLQEAAKSANKVKSGPDLLVKKMKASDVGEINPHPRRYYPEQDISDEELGNALGLKKKPAPSSQPEGPFKPGMGPGAMLKRGAKDRVFYGKERSGFHAAPAEAHDAIATKGLVPHRPENTMFPEMAKKGVYFSQGDVYDRDWLNEHNIIYRANIPDKTRVFVDPESEDYARDHASGHTGPEFYGKITGPHFYTTEGIGPEHLSKVWDKGEPMHPMFREDRLDDIDVKQRIEGRLRRR